MNLDFAKVTGKHNAIYEAYYKQIDPKGSGAIEAMTAAKFLKKSGLSDVVLSRIWDLSDPNGKGYLDKPGFFVALKLVSLAQAGQVINMSNIYTDTINPPKVGDIPKIMPMRIPAAPVPRAAPAGAPAGAPSTNADWSIKIIDRLKYEQLFESLKPVGGMLPGNKVKGVLMDSKLPMDTLGKIWDLADQDKDGNLDKHEFIVAMHLVYQTLEKRIVPDVLPPELRKAGGAGPPPKPAPPIIATANVASMPRAPSGEGFGDGGFVANFPKDIAPPPAIPPLPAAAVPPMQRVPAAVAAAMQQPLIPTDPLIPISAPSNVDWVVTPGELKRYEVMFRDADRDKDGLVSGLEVKSVFLQSGVPQICLAHIWALCDTNQSGKLSLEQFALAMWMVERKQQGIEPPQVLTASMVPPSMKGIVGGVDLQAQAEPKPTYSNPELEMISKEIEELAKERRALETEIAQKEADIRIKSGEVRSLQSELDTLSATLKQLENQRGEAQKRLDDLKLQVNKIREQCQMQEDTINEQEGELNSKRSELQKLKDEETALQREYEENNKELQTLSKHLQNTQLQISSVRSMVTQLMETQRQMTDALLMCRAAIESSDSELVTEYQLKIEPDFDDARRTLERKLEETKPDPFSAISDNGTKRGTNGFAANGFGNDPFTSNGGVSAINTARGGFDDSFNTTSGFDSGFDAFGAGGGGAAGAFGAPQKDPFGSDAFSGSKINAVTPEPGKDDFGSDPFAALHAPTGQGQVLSPNAHKSGPPPRPESPSPALPPKKSKVPPPRPAPPRPLQAPARPSQPAMDAFGAPTNSSGFADFADFDNKQPTIPTPPLKITNIITTTTTNNNNATTTITPTPSPLLSAAAATLSSSLAATALTLNSSGSSSGGGGSFFQTSSASAVSSISTPTLSSLSLPSTTISSPSSTISSSSSNSNKTHLNRSNATLQQAAIFNSNTATTTEAARLTPTPAIFNNNSHNNNIKPATPVITGPTDFSDDPFKDYRYEDPFNIQDPFADEQLGSGDNVFKDDLSSDDDMPFTVQLNNKNNAVNAAPTNTSMTSTSSNTFNSAKSNTPLSNEFLEHFDAFNMQPSPVPSQKSSTSGGGAAGGGTATTARSVHTPIGGSVFDNFADFDAFAAPAVNSNSNSSSNNKTIASSDGDSINSGNNNNKSNSTNNTITEKSNNNNSNANDSFFDAFNDNFLIHAAAPVDATKTTHTTASLLNAFGAAKTLDDAFGGSATNIAAFDAFSSNSSSGSNSTISKSAKVFDDFNDNAFEDDFFKNNTTTTTTKTNLQNDINFTTSSSSTGSSSKNDNFAKFDAFAAAAADADADFAENFATALNNSINLDGDFGGATLQKLHKVQNNTTLSKTNNNAKAAAAVTDSGVKLPAKFADDYSQSAEGFDNDLEEAIKRSMLEK